MQQKNNVYKLEQTDFYLSFKQVIIGGEAVERRIVEFYRRKASQLLREERCGKSAYHGPHIKARD